MKSLLAASLVALPVLATAAAPIAASAAEAARAPARLAYSLTLAGIPIARADVDFDDRGGKYALGVDWHTTGLVGVFAAASGSVGADGRLVSGRPHPRNYRLSERKGDTPFEVTMALSGGRVGRLEVEPPAKTGEDIVPVTAAHRVGVVDPVSAGLIPGATAPDAVCNRVLPVFDGWSRWNLHLSPKAIETEAPAGMIGPVAVCAVRWEPVAGHRSGHRSVRYMAENRDVEVRLARLPDRNVWLPVETSVGTMLGTARVTLQSVSAR